VLVGLVGGLVYAVCLRLGLGAVVAAIWAVAAQLWLTGALHEDGLADTADGFGGGADRASKLAIMRDSRIGAYGAIALMLVLGLRVAVIASHGAVAAIWGLVAAGASGRAALVLLLWRLPAARADGVAAGLQKPSVWSVAISTAVAVLIAFCVDLRLIVAAGVAGVGAGWLARRQIGGYTGDVLGASEQLVETAVLSFLA
jgi:adenosylcobinamide-GDP ribazoletransferase